MMLLVDAFQNGEELSGPQLSEALHFLAAAYYTGEALVPDAVFDAMQDALRVLDPDAPALQQVGAETKGAAAHAIPMLSLQKCTTQSGFDKWVQDVQTYVARPKYDGIAISLHYKHGKLLRAATRGNGRVGEVVTDVLVLAGLGRTQGLWTAEVRGELVLPLSKVPPTGSHEATHPRNLVAGVLARKGVEAEDGAVQAEDLRFYAYDLPAELDLNELQKIAKLQSMGFNVGVHREIAHREGAECGPNVWFPQRGTWDFPADGVVCREVTGHITECTGHHPKHSIAWKFPAESSSTKVEDIEWQTTRYGTVTPVAILDTVKVDGSMISRATLHSYGRFLKLGLRNGSRVQIARRGGVIPHVEGVLSLGEGRVFRAPSHCPSCDAPLLDKEGGLDEEGNVARTLFCTGATCLAQTSDAIRHWFAALGADGFGPRASKELARKAGNVLGVYRLQWEDPSVRRMLGAANAIKLKEQLDTVAKYPGPVALLVALGIPALGNTLARVLTERWSIEELFDVTEEQLLDIAGVGDITARSVVLGLAHWLEPLTDLIAEDLLVLPQMAEKKQIAAGPLSGEVVCFTGTLELPRKKAQDLARQAGAQVSDSLIVGVTCVVMGADVIDGTSTKARKAYDMQRRLGNLKIWSEQDFLRQAVQDVEVR